jgi:hypothetical protein
MSASNEENQIASRYRGFRDVARYALERMPNASTKVLLRAALDSESIPMTPFEETMLLTLLDLADKSLMSLKGMLEERAPGHPLTELVNIVTRLVNASSADAVGRGLDELEAKSAKKASNEPDAEPPKEA